LAGMGIEPERLKLVWASAAEGAKFAHEITTFVEAIQKLGPLSWPQWESVNGHAEVSVPQPEEVVV
jgi:hypothetical protein